MEKAKINTSFGFFHWLRIKRYQYEVTLPLYVMTPGEQFVFNAFLFLFVASILTALSFSLSQMCTTLFARMWEYFAEHLNHEEAVVVLSGDVAPSIGAMVSNQTASMLQVAAAAGGQGSIDTADGLAAVGDMPGSGPF